MEIARFNEEECCKCGVPFGVRPQFQVNRREDKAQFYCPNGHPQAYLKSTSDQLRRTLEDKNGLLLQKDAEITRLERQLKKLRKPKGNR